MVNFIVALDMQELLTVFIINDHGIFFMHYLSRHDEILLLLSYGSVSNLLGTGSVGTDSNSQCDSDHVKVSKFLYWFQFISHLS